MNDASTLFLIIAVGLVPFIGAGCLLWIAKPTKEDKEQEAYMQTLYKENDGT